MSTQESTQESAQEIISQLNLQSHPEGGYYRRVYTSDMLVDTRWTDQKRPCSSAILYLLEEGAFSAFHRLKSDEIWHFYRGCTVTLYSICSAGELVTQSLGCDVGRGERPMVIMPANTWFAAVPNGSYALLGCTVSPGFDFADFELAKRTCLCTQYPQHSAVISRLTRG